MTIPMLKIKMLACVLAVVISAEEKLYAQGPVTVTWALSTDQAATLNGAGANRVNALPQSLKGLTVAAKNPYSENGQKTAPLGIGGPWAKEAGPSGERYVLYAVTPAKGFTLSVSQVQLDVSMEGTNSNSVNIAWSTDTTGFTNLAPNFAMPGVAMPVTKTYTIKPVEVPAGKTFYIRVSPWTTGNASGGKYLVSRNVIITGTISKQ
jgi:hypothetical protein